MIATKTRANNAPNFIAMNFLLSLVAESKRVGLTEIPIASLEEVLNRLKG